MSSFGGNGIADNDLSNFLMTTQAMRGGVTNDINKTGNTTTNMLLNQY
jgi:hypothetical protein